MGTNAFMSRRPRRAQAGQALVEAAIVTPVMVFLILGALQIMVLQHARIMTEYAAYNAARAGVVHDANWNVMRNAALLSALPLYDRTDTLPRFLATWARAKAAAEITEAVDTGAGTLERLAGGLLGVEISGIAQDISLIEIEVTSPDAGAFRTAQEHYEDRQGEATDQIDPRGRLRYPSGEIDFDDQELLTAHPEAGRLGVEVRVLYPLRIPIVNKIIFELWLAQLTLNARAVESDLTEWAKLEARVEGGARSGMALEDAVAEGEGEGPLDDFFTTGQWNKELRTLRWIAARFGAYLLPLHATCAMQMQSNAFESNRREPVWFGID